MLELFHFEACPFCAKVRRKLEVLGLDYISRPSLPGSQNREFLGRMTKELQFPLLIDTEKNVLMIESDDICDYLEKHYGQGKQKRGE